MLCDCNTARLIPGICVVSKCNTPNYFYTPNQLRPCQVLLSGRCASNNMSCVPRTWQSLSGRFQEQCLSRAGVSQHKWHRGIWQVLIGGYLDWQLHTHTKLQTLPQPHVHHSSLWTKSPSPASLKLWQWEGSQGRIDKSKCLLSAYQIKSCLIWWNPKTHTGSHTHTHTQRKKIPPLLQLLLFHSWLGYTI